MSLGFRRCLRTHSSDADARGRRTVCSGNGRRMISFRPNSLTDLLVRGRNADGGWGYYPAKWSRIEPTCWAGLCLARADRSLKDVADAASRWLVARLLTDGFLDDQTGAAPNLGFNGLGALALRNTGTSSPELRRLLSALAAVKGVALEEDEATRQDGTLQGWSWVQGTFSWVEPTSWCLLALKKSPTLAKERSARIEEAERLLLDRVCQTGGWNYGNSNMLGQKLYAHVPTTALALLALQDRREHPLVQKSLDYLIQRRLSEPAGMALSLTSICLRVYGVPAPDVEERLGALSERHSFFNNLHVSAMALYALSGPDHGVEDFRL